MLKKILVMAMLSPVGLCAQTKPATNLLLTRSNVPTQFDKVTPVIIADAVAKVIKESDARIKAITSVPAGKQTVANTLIALDELNYGLSDLGGKISVIEATYVDDKTRNAATEQSEKLSAYNSDITLNVDLYNALKRFAATPAAKAMRPDQKKLLKESLISFEINGTKLDAAGRAALKRTNEKLIALGSRFSRNIAEHKDSLKLTADEVKGVPENLSKAWKRADGSYMVIVNGPNNNNIMKYANDENTRRMMLTKYYNRAYPANIAVLDSMFYYRQQLAEQLGFKTYAEYALVQKMAAKPSNVWSFLEDLRDKLTPHVPEALGELKALKKQLHPELDDTLYAWDNSYYGKKMLDAKYQLNTDELKPYFEMNNTIKGMFGLYEKLFGFTIREVKGVPVWYSKVKTYALYKDGKKMGSFYLDLYPRPNKYTHFACFNISMYHLKDGKETLPSGALICNFPEGAVGEPSLLNHGDVVTLFHEFGHLIHFMLSHPALSSQSAFNTKGDFVEAPSQFLENFTWNYDCLKLFAKHYKTGEVMPKELFDKLNKARLVGISNAQMYQVYLSMLDFTYEDKYPLTKQKGINQISTDLYSMTQMPFPAGTHFICAFDHLNSYGANYYGYLWSKVYAQDIFSVFEKNGVLSPVTGARYRKEVLEKGATIDEATMLENFLGRKPNSDAFFRWMGL
ncbi:M3 family metallopeptidase [Mucilaginibacter auburnensis]|uniref:Thimet oligopeptidase/oligopeptidase A n=1 Tax=Mucilaginibacter auburnensis TaxID=1457233 RepID=A0A2H9VSP2_9SPHI|nr:M3 family metallopeptidase [Mucilaginibacter auburnensis]PJJ83851.1 thimet oligopeptidase/oligopeptidase A [Mucilaginibacter auburnensis]